MRLDRYIGDEPKYRIQRRQPDGTYKEVPAFDYFVLALRDANTHAALMEYAKMAAKHGDHELAHDMRRLADETYKRTDRKLPD